MIKVTYGTNHVLHLQLKVIARLIVTLMYYFNLFVIMFTEEALTN